MFGIVRKKAAGRITVCLKAKLQPIDRGELEDAFDAICKERAIDAQVVGGGSLLADNGEVQACDIEIQIEYLDDRSIETVKKIFESMLAPKGSYIAAPDKELRLDFGSHEGLGLYLNGTDLEKEVYESCDANFVYEECERLLKDVAIVNSHWQGPTETALYMYGKSFEEIERRIKPLIYSYPLCRKARIVRIA